MFTLLLDLKRRKIDDNGRENKIVLNQDRLETSSPASSSGCRSVSPRSMNSPLDLRPRSATDDSTKSVSKTNSANKIEMLDRIFPEKSKSELEKVLQDYDGDMVKTIDYLLEARKTNKSSVSNPLAEAYQNQYSYTNPFFKSAFSPVSSGSDESALNSMRYAWGAFSLPYSSVVPGFPFGTNYAALNGLSSNSMKPFPYSFYPYGTPKLYPAENTEKV